MTTTASNGSTLTPPTLTQATVEESWMDPEDMKNIADIDADETELEAEPQAGGQVAGVGT